MPRLKLLRGRASWNECQLDADLNVVGRDASRANIVLQDANNVVSRRHAAIIRDTNRYYIVDCSKAGTTLNNRRLVKSERYLLASNDLIQICNHVLTFLDSSDEQVGSNDSVRLDDSDSSGFSAVVELSSGSWRSRKAANSQAKLATMIELTQNLRNRNSLEELLDHAIDTLLSLYGQAHRGIVVLTRSRVQQTVTSVARYREGEEVQTAIVSTGLIEAVAARRVAALADDGLMICAPLIDEDDECLGVIRLDSRTRPFSQDDLDVFATAATVLAMVVENRALHELALRAREMHLELKVANEVQIGLLPADLPRIKGYEFFDYYSPAKKVGGDYYDYIEGDGQRLAVVLGDVAGKGIPAALFMAKVASEMSVFLNSGLDPVSVLNQLNRRFDTRNPRNTLVTMVLAILDYMNHEVVLVNAGHMAPLVRQADGTVKEVGREHTGLPLGVKPTCQYGESRVPIGVGETIVFYSDGVTDALSPEGERYGTARLRAILSEHLGDASSFGERIMEDIHQFVMDAQQFDDMCLVSVSRNAAV